MLKFYKIGFFSSLLLLVLGAVVSFYLLVDQGVTITYQQESHKDTVRDMMVLMEIISETKGAKPEVDEILQGHPLYAAIPTESDTLTLSTIILYFDKGQLQRVSQKFP